MGSMRIHTTRFRRGVVLAAIVALAAAALTASRATAGGLNEEASTHMTESDLERNKETVVNYYTLSFNEGKPAEAVKRYVGDTYIQHNPLAPDGPEAFIDFVSSFKTQFPELNVDIRTVIAEGDRVMTHALITTSPEDRGMVAADIFRLDDNGKIVEHWDVVQPFPEESANPHPMF
jgi:predicted SnoaL-like aldol condensation-catalyzing enzyme